jgi:putative holliday junction resolvase
MAKTKKQIGIDYGEARIGIAQALEGSMVATVRGIIKGTGDPKKNVELLLAELQDIEAIRFIVGLPIHMNGTESIMSEKVRQFAKHLELATGVPVDLWDERLSSAQINNLLKEGGVKRKERNKKSDALAATLILQSYLESKLI